MIYSSKTFGEGVRDVTGPESGRTGGGGVVRARTGGGGRGVTSRVGSGQDPTYNFHPDQPVKIALRILICTTLQKVTFVENELD
jgi:hypothetical protein